VLFPRISMALIHKSFATLAVLAAIAFGMLTSGMLTRMGFFRYLDRYEARRGQFYKGIVPACVEGTPWGLTEDQMPNLNGQTFVVTGANAGLGYWTAFHLAKANASSVVVACRNMQKCHKAVAALIESTGQRNMSVIPMEVDLSSFGSVLNFVAEFKRNFAEIDGLVLNAGVGFTPFSKTKDGIELQMGTNHFGHQLLAQELLPLVREAAKARRGATIVAVSGAIHMESYPEGVFPDINTMNDEGRYDPHTAYAQSKLANVLFAQELSELVSGTGVLVNSVNPGIVESDITRPLMDQLENRVGSSIRKFVETEIFHRFVTPFFWQPRDGALTQVYAALAAKVKVSGKYFDPVGRESMPDPHARNKTLQKHLWKVTENFIADWKAANLEPTKQIISS